MSDQGRRPDLDDLISRFEEDVRRRPTPDEVLAAERAGIELPEFTEAPVAAAAPVPEPVAIAPVDITPEVVPIAPVDATPESVPLSPVQATPEPVQVEAIPAPAPAAPAPAAPVQVTPEAALPEDLKTWWAAGERVEVELPGGYRHRVFVRVLGEGPWLTCLHGFPTSSWDWAKVAPALRQGHSLLLFDLLGFGDSDKPTDHDWSAFEQADIVEALWDRFGIDRTEVLAHDVGLTVALELLARQDERKLRARVSRVILLNGGVYAGFHRPRPIQVWLQRPLVGSLVARMLTEGRFVRALAEVFDDKHQPGAAELHQHWLSVTRRQGARNYHRLIRYIAERRVHARRWEEALATASIPIRYVWGMADPVSGTDMAYAIRQRDAAADLVELPGVGHYPHLEEPGRVVEEVNRRS